MEANYKTHPNEYRAWAGMRTRCHNPAFKDWHLYGGRGITICARWDSFAAFFEDLGTKPSPRHSLDRFPNPHGNYEPGNARWATPKEQARNWSKRNRRIAFDGRVMTLSAWAEETGLVREVLRDRLDSGWTIRRALTTPAIHNRQRTPGGTFAKAFDD